MHEASIVQLKNIADSLLNRESSLSHAQFTSYECSSLRGSHYIPLCEIAQPYRENGRIWFRDEETIINLITAMIDRKPLPPVEVFSKGKINRDQHILRNGFHRYYASLALNYRLIPIIINDWDFEN
jgi:hypothetical protein